MYTLHMFITGRELEGSYLLTGPLTTISAVLGLRKEAVERVLRETAEGRECKIYSSRGSVWPAHYYAVKRAP